MLSSLCLFLSLSAFALAPLGTAKTKSTTVAEERTQDCMDSVDCVDCMDSGQWTVAQAELR